MIDYSFLALHCLRRAIERDAMKGGSGYRSTSEVAVWIGASTRATRETLYRLFEADLVDCCDERPLVWRITEPAPFEPDPGETDDMPLAA